MATTVESRAKWTDLIAGVGLEFADVFDQGQEEYRPGINKVLTETSGSGAQRNFTGKTGVGRLEKFDDGDDLPGGSRHRTYDTKVVYNNYGKYLDVTKNAIEDRDFNEELDEMKDLSIAANFSQDEAGMQLFNGGFSTSTSVNGYEITLYGDGVPTYSTKHPTQVPGASTQSNASSTSVAFSHDALETGHVALVEQQTDDGLPMTMLGKASLVVPPALKRDGREELESELSPDLDTDETDQNAINVFKGEMNLITSTFLANANGGSDTAWFLTIPQRDKQYHEVRQSPTMEQETNIKNKVVTFTVDARWANYVRDWRRKWGSKGDGSSYSS